MSDTEILSPTSENGDNAITKKRMSEDVDSSDESSSYDDKVASSQNGINGKEVHSNGKEDNEDESEDEGSHGFRMDGEPDYKPRKARAASSSSESEEDADDVEDDDDDDSSARSNRVKQMKSEDDSAISKSSESAVAPNEGNNSSSDTEDDAREDINEDDEEVDASENMTNAPVPMARKVSVPADTTDELSREEYELSKRETVNVEDAARKISAVEINDSDSETEEDANQARKYSSSLAEEVPAKNIEEEKHVSRSSSSSEDADESGPIIVDADDVQPRPNGGAEIRRPQFRHSSSSLSDEEIQMPSEASPKHKIEERKQQLAAAAQEVERPPSSQSPLPTRANADKITKMYTEAIGNNNNDQNGSSKATERAKPTKDITSIYTQAMVKTATPPASPKPVPSKNRGDITQLYTGGLSTKAPNGNGSPCIVADKLSPKKEKAAGASSDDDSSSEEGADDVDNESDDTTSSHSDKMLKGKSVRRHDSDTSKDSDSSKVIVESSSDTDNDTCEDLDDKESTDENLQAKQESSFDKQEEQVTKNDEKLSQMPHSREVPEVMMNGVPEVHKSNRTPKLLFSDEVQVKIESDSVPSPNQSVDPRPVIDVDEARKRAEKVVAAVFAEAKEVAEAAAVAEAKAKSKENISDSEESQNGSHIKDEIDAEMDSIEDTKHRKYSSSEDSSEDSSGAYSPSSSSSNEDRSKRAKPDFLPTIDSPKAASTEMSAKVEVEKIAKELEKDTKIVEDSSKPSPLNNKKKEEIEEEIDIDLDDPEVGKVAAKLQSGFFSKFGRKSTPPASTKPTQSQTLEKREERKPSIPEPAGVFSSITSFMSSTPKVEPAQPVPVVPSNDEKQDSATINTQPTESVIATTTTKNVEKLDATKHGTNLDTENNKKEEEEEIDIDLNDPEVGKVAAKLQSGFFSRFGRKTETTPITKSTQPVEKNTSETTLKHKECVSKNTEKESTSSVNDVTKSVASGAAQTSSNTSSETKVSKTEDEEEIDIDLNDPAVGKVAAQLQTGFFSKFGRKTDSSKSTPVPKVEPITKEDSSQNKPSTESADKSQPAKITNTIDKPANKKDDEEEEIDIDLTDPEVGKVAEKLQAGFFSRFGMRKDPPKKSEPSKPDVISNKSSIISGNIVPQPFKSKNIEQNRNKVTFSSDNVSKDTSKFKSNNETTNNKPQSVLTKEGKEALTNLAEKNKHFTEDLNKSVSTTQKPNSSMVTAKEVKNPVAKTIPKPMPRKNAYEDHVTEEQKKMNAELGVKRAQFCYSSSSPSDEEAKNVSFDLTKQQIVEQRKKQLGVSTTVINPTPVQKSPRPSHGRVIKVDKVTKIYTGAPVVNQMKDSTTAHSSVKRWSQPSFDGYEKSTASKNIKNIKQMYNQAIAEATTPPCSPKPGPSTKVRKNVAQIYTSNIPSPVSASPYISPCVSADNLSPRKHNMATAVDKDSIRQAYEDVRSDNSETEWAVFKFEGNNLNVTATGKDFKDFKSAFTNDDRGFGYIRISTGDEMSKRAKFVFVTWVGPSVSVMKKAKMSTDKALMKDIIQNLSVELQLENHAEFSHDFFKGQVDRASGARYGTGERAL